MSNRNKCPRSPQNSCPANESPPSMFSSGGSCLADESPPSFNTTPATQYISDISQPSLIDMSTTFFLNNTCNSSCPSSPATQNNSWNNSTMTPEAFNQFHSAMPSWVDVWTPQPRPRPRPLMGRASPQYSLPAEAPWSPQRQCPFTPNLNASMQQADLFAEDLDGSVPDNFNQMHSAIPPWVDVWTPPRPRPETLYDDRNRGYPPSPSSPSGPCSPFGGRAPPNSPAPECPVRGPPTKPPSRSCPCPPVGDPNQSPLGNFTEDSLEEVCTPHATGRQFVPSTPPRSTACPTPAYRPRSINMDDVSSESTIDISSEPESSLHMRPYESLSVIEEDLSGERPYCGSPPYHSTPRRQSVCPRPSYVTRSINMDDVSSEPESSLHMRPYESLAVIQEDESGERPSVCRPPPRTAPRRPAACPRPAPTTCPTSLDFSPYVPYSTPPRAERSVEDSLPDPFNYMMSSMPSMIDCWTPQPRPPAVNLLADMNDLPQNLKMPLKAIEHAKKIKDMRNAEYEAECPNRFSGRRSCPGRPQINQALQNMNPRPNPLYYTCMNIGNERVDDESAISMHSPGPEHLSDVSAPDLCNISTSFVPQGPQVATGRLLDLSSPRPVQRPHPVHGLQNISDETSPELCDMSIGTPLPPRRPYPAAGDSSLSGSMNESVLDSVLKKFEDLKIRNQYAYKQGESSTYDEDQILSAGVKSTVKTTTTEIDGQGGVVTERIVERSTIENGEVQTKTTHTISKADACGNVTSETIEATRPSGTSSPARPAANNQSRVNMSVASKCPNSAGQLIDNVRRKLDFELPGDITADFSIDQLGNVSMPSFGSANACAQPLSSTRIQNLPSQQASTGPNVCAASLGRDPSMPSPMPNQGPITDQNSARVDSQNVSGSGQSPPDQQPMENQMANADSSVCDTTVPLMPSPGPAECPANIAPLSVNMSTMPLTPDKSSGEPFCDTTASSSGQNENQPNSPRVRSLPSRQIFDRPPAPTLPNSMSSTGPGSASGNVPARTQRWDDTSVLRRNQSQLCDVTPPSGFIDPTLPFPYAESPPPGPGSASGNVPARTQRWDDTSVLRRNQSQLCDATPPSGFIDATMPFPYAASPPPGPRPHNLGRSQSLSRAMTCSSPIPASGRSQSVPRDVLSRYQALKKQIDAGGACQSPSPQRRPSPCRRQSNQECDKNRSQLSQSPCPQRMSSPCRSQSNKECDNNMPQLSQQGRRQQQNASLPNVQSCNQSTPSFINSTQNTSGMQSTPNQNSSYTPSMFGNMESSMPYPDVSITSPGRRQASTSQTQLDDETCPFDEHTFSNDDSPSFEEMINIEIKASKHSITRGGRSPNRK